MIDNIKGTFRKHLTIVEGDDGVIRIYNSVEEDHLVVYTSTDGVHFDRPDQGRGEINGHRNIVIPDMVGGLGNPFWDPQGQPDERWKYFTDYQRRGIYLYTSADGYDWTRRRNIILPFRSGTQSSTYYDDQRQVYMAYHRSGIFHTPGGVTQRSSVVTEHKDLRATLPFTPLSQQEYLDLRAEYPLRDPLPWWADNGPLTPGGFGMEYPHLFDPIPEDPVGVDFYLTKAMKYPYASDTYVAFPVGYFHYYGDGPEARTVLGLEQRGLGSGPLESQIAVSRNGLDWKRYPAPAYVGIGRHQGRNVVTAYIGHGMIRRGEELWQYYFGETQYHSAITKDPDGRGVYRLVQRLDGFVSLDSPYGHETTAITRALTFTGDRLQLNVDTDAVGYMQVGFLDEQGQDIEGYTVDDCVYINGDFIAKEIDWLETGADLSPLAGRTVQVVLRMRGAKLYAMQFVERRIKTLHRRTTRPQQTTSAFGLARHPRTRRSAPGNAGHLARIRPLEHQHPPPNRRAAPPTPPQRPPPPHPHPHPPNHHPPPSPPAPKPPPSTSTPTPTSSTSPPQPAPTPPAPAPPPPPYASIPQALASASAGSRHHHCHHQPHRPPHRRRHLQRPQPHPQPQHRPLRRLRPHHLDPRHRSPPNHPRRPQRRPRPYLRHRR